MEQAGTVELVLLDGGRSGDADVSREAAGDPPPARPELRLIEGGPASDLQAAIEETVAAARNVRREIEERIARALDDLLRTRAPDTGPR